MPFFTTIIIVHSKNFGILIVCGFIIVCVVTHGEFIVDMGEEKPLLWKGSMASVLFLGCHQKLLSFTADKVTSAICAAV